MQIKFTIPGEPFGKQRPRFNTRTGRAYTPSETTQYETAVKYEYLQKYGDFRYAEGVPLEIIIKAYLGIPNSDSKKKRGLKEEGKIKATKKPDWDNIGKIIADALNKVAYEDDKDIILAVVTKEYSREPRVEVTIREYQE